jgi:hypothetical protein
MHYVGIWWDYTADEVPVLQKYAMRILSQSCSASSCERNWSAFEAAQTKKRNRLSHKMLNTLVYIRMNTMMMDKYSDMMTKDLEPINLDNLSINDLPEYVDDEERDSDALVIQSVTDDDYISTNNDLLNYGEDYLASGYLSD